MESWIEESFKVSFENLFIKTGIQYNNNIFVLVSVLRNIKFYFILIVPSVESNRSLLLFE